MHVWHACLLFFFLSVRNRLSLKTTILTNIWIRCGRMGDQRWSRYGSKTWSSTTPFNRIIIQICECKLLLQFFLLSILFKIISTQKYDYSKFQQAPTIHSLPNKEMLVDPKLTLLQHHPLFANIADSQVQHQASPHSKSFENLDFINQPQSIDMGMGNQHETTMIMRKMGKYNWLTLFQSGNPI